METPTTVDAGLDIVTWAEQHWRPASRRGAPIILEDHQRRILRHVFQGDRDGRWPYDTVLWSEPKKSGKSELGGLAAGWAGVTEGPYADVFVLANDLEQSKSRSFTALIRAIRGFPPEHVTIQADKVILSNGSVIQALPCDWAGSAGANPVLTCWDELWAYSKESSRRLWDEMAPVPTRRNSMRFVTTYAGHTGESELLEELYHRGLEGQPVPELEDISDGDGSPACRAIDGMFMFWSHKPRMPWQTPEYYARQRAAPGFRQSAYLRLHENRWQAPESSFVTSADWEACKAFVRDLDVDRPMLVAGVDGAIRQDGFAVVVVSRDPDPAKHDDSIAVRAVKVWEPQNGQDIDFNEPFEWLKRFAARHTLIKVTYDEWGLADWARRFQRETGVYCAPFSQGADRNRADDLLFELIRSRRIVHNGDAQLAQHIGNAGWKEVAGDQEGRGRLVKLAKHRKIDAAVATAMASYECLRLLL